MSINLHNIEIMSNQQIEVEMGDRIRRRRLDMNMSQAELALRAGVARRTITSGAWARLLVANIDLAGASSAGVGVDRSIFA